MHGESLKLNQPVLLCISDVHLSVLQMNNLCKLFHGTLSVEYKRAQQQTRVSKRVSVNQLKLSFIENKRPTSRGFF